MARRGGPYADRAQLGGQVGEHRIRDAFTIGQQLRASGGDPQKAIRQAGGQLGTVQVAEQLIP